MVPTDLASRIEGIDEFVFEEGQFDGGSGVLAKELGRRQDVSDINVDDVTLAHVTVAKAGTKTKKICVLQ